jgi:outer membrane protein OmpA-like peptidoglycan-associated protein
MKLIKLTLLISLAPFSLNSKAAEPQNWQESWYIGGAIGKSTLTPDGGDHWQVTDDQSLSKKLYTGINITQEAGLEAFWADLGDSHLSSASQTGRVNYKAIGITGVYKPRVHIAGVRPLAKLGIAKFTTEDKGDLNSKQLNDVSVFMGLGAEYALADNINLRAEYERYDKDIQHYNIGLNWRPLQQNRSRIIEKVVPQPPKPNPAFLYTPPQPVIYRPPPRPVAIPLPEPVITPVIAAVIKRPQIRIIHSTLSGGSNFNTGSSQLTLTGQNRLNKLAYDIQKSDMKIKSLHIKGHTDDVGNEQANLALSLARAKSVANYLQNLGMNRHLMRLDGKGETRPLAPNNTAEGRAKNRRVEIAISVLKTVIKP